MNVLAKLVSKELRLVADKIDSGTCNLSSDESMEILRAVAHEALSKDQACAYLNIKTSRFDDLVREGKIPRGRKVRGFKELRWYKDELIPLTRQ